MDTNFYMTVDGADMENISTRIRNTDDTPFIVCNGHHGWGRFQVIEVRDDLYILQGRTGQRTLSKSEAAKHWSLVDNKRGLYRNGETGETRDIAHATYLRWISEGNSKAQDWEQLSPFKF